MKAAQRASARTGAKSSSALTQERDREALEWIAHRTGLQPDKLRKLLLEAWRAANKPPRERPGPSPTITADVTVADLRDMSAQIFFAGFRKADAINPVAARIAKQCGVTKALEIRKIRAAVRARLSDFTGGNSRKNARNKGRG